MKKSILPIIIILLFSMMVILPWAFEWGKFDENSTSTGEVRDLAEMPKELTNSWFSEFEDFFNDHSPMRLTIIELGKSITESFKETYQDKITPVLKTIFGESNNVVPNPTPSGTVDMGDLFNTPTPVPTSSDPDSTPGPSTEPISCNHEFETVRKQEASFMHDGYTLKHCYVCGEYVVDNIVMRTSITDFYKNWPMFSVSGAGFRGGHDWYFYAGDNSIGYYQGDNVLSESEMKSWKDTFEKLKTVCDKKGIKLVVLACPNKEQVYSEYLPSGLDNSKADSEKRESIFTEYMKTNSSVTYLYPLQKLKTAKILYETYSQQDTHWNSIGGFIAGMEVLSSLGYDTIGIQNLEVSEYETSGGDLVHLGVGSSTKYTGYSTNYKAEIALDYVCYSNSVSGGNVSGELRKYISGANTTKNAVIIGDSFRHAIGPYIAKNFKETVVGHRGDFDYKSEYEEDTKINQYVIKNAVKALKEGDLLLVMAVERYDEANVNMAATLYEFLK